MLTNIYVLYGIIVILAVLCTILLIWCLRLRAKLRNWEIERLVMLSHFD